MNPGGWNLFQWLTIPPLAALLLADVVAFARGRETRGTRAFRALVWTVAALAIAHPEYTSYAARAFGIDRGTDLVLYLFALAFLGASFFFYGRAVSLQHQLTEVVRHLAIRDCRRGGDCPPAPGRV